MTFVFDKNYNNLEQVAPFWDDYVKVFEEVTADGAYPYDDSFLGRIPGIEGDNEKTAIYLLQHTRHLKDLNAQVAAAYDNGYVDFEQSMVDEKPVRFSSIVNYGFYSGGTGWKQYDEARLLRLHNGTLAVLPKGKRTNGYYLSGGKVLVKV